MTAVALALYFTGNLEPLETSLLAQRFELLERPASGEIVVAQIDARSLREVGVWPWPRQLYAETLERLFEAGVTEVALDIDFSAASSPQADAAMAAVLARYGGRVILPAFQQFDSLGDPAAELVTIRPLTRFGARAALGTVNVRPDQDGVVRTYPVGRTIDGRFLPSLAALLAGTQRFDYGQFYIDLSLRPETLPRVSVTDLLNGRVEPSRLAGRRVVVGATALELGDFLTVPAQGVVSGVTLQALAAESILQDRAVQRTGPLVTVALCLLIALASVSLLPRLSWRGATVATLSVGVLLPLAALGLQSAEPISLDIAAPLLLLGLAGAARSVREIELQAVLLFKQRMAALYRRALMAKVVEDSFDGIVITDSRGRIELFNPAAETILGVDAEGAAGRPLLEVIPDLARLETERSAEAPSARELRLTDTTGRARVLEVHTGVSLLNLSRHPRERRAKSRTVHVYTFRDVTERIEAQAAAESAAVEAEMANRAKTAFLANMSHELRTPLNAVIGFSEIIAKELLGPIQPPGYREYGEHIHRSGSHLLELVSDILDVAKIESGRFEVHLEEVSPSSCVEDCAQMMRASLDPEFDRHLEVEVEEQLPRVVADKRLMRQILLNLLGNAVKFSPTQGRIVLSAYRTADRWLALEVRDNGIGIPDDKLAEVTKPFVQVENAYSRSHEGSGLGLYLATQFAVLQGGRLEIESELDKGTTVRLLLPPAPSLPETTPEPLAINA